MIMVTQIDKFVKKIIAIVEPHLTSFMQVLGIDEVYEVRGDKDFIKSIKDAFSRDEVAIVITQRSLVKKHGIPEQVKVYPIVVSLPDKPEDLGVEAIDVYREFIRRFIGYEIYINL